MSLLCGMPISADVVASEPSVLFGATSKEFDGLLRRRPELVEYLAGELAARLKRTNEQLALQQQRQAVLSKLISYPSEPSFRSDLPHLGKRLMTAAAEAGNSDSPLLIVGEKGVGKRTLSLYIHSMGARRNKAIIVVDCRELPRDNARSLLFGDAQPEFVSRFAEHLGYLQAADRGTLILANADRLPAEVQEDLAVFLRAHKSSSEDARVDVRVIATVDAKADNVGAQGGLCEALSEALSSEQGIRLKPLRKRRRDVIPLAEHFLQQAAQLDGGPRKRLDESAKRKLLGHDFRFENAEELRQVLNLGADLAESEIITAEHLFFGARVGAETPHFDLLRWAWLEQALSGGYLVASARVLVGIAFSGIVAACLVAPTSLVGKVANAAVWGVWWPALIATSILLGRIWCAVCPLGSGAEVVQRVAGRWLSPTNRLKEAGPTLALIGFAGIIWTEHATSMSAHPRATAALLLGLTAIAVALGWLYERHTWCRYLCPLGAMCAAFSVGSAVRVRARKEVCQGVCTGNECYKGSDRAKGCPMFNHVAFMSDGQHCKLCLECIRACPSQAARLVLQLPVRDIWRAAFIGTDLAPVIIVAGTMALLLAAIPPSNAGLQFGSLWFALGTLAAIGLGLACKRFLQQAEQTENGGIPWMGRAVYAYAFSVAAALFALQLSFLPGLNGVHLHVVGITAEPFRASLLQIAQGAAIGLGGLLTLWTLWGICRQGLHPPLSKPMWVIIPLGLLAVAYLVGELSLLALH